MSDELQQELIEATTEFGIAYAVAKEAEKGATAAKNLFYELADRKLASRRLPQKTITVTGEGDYTVAEYVATYYPEWRIVELQNDDFPYQILLEKDPSKMKYSFVNPVDGQLYQRTTQDKGAAQVDVERLKKEDPKLWEEVSHWDPTAYELVDQAINWALQPDAENVSIDIFFQKMHPELRVLKPVVAWSQSQTGRLQQYLIPPGITVKIVAPRKATDEELENVQTEEE